jgi:hypothetical protein
VRELLEVDEPPVGDLCVVQRQTPNLAK